MEVIAEAISAYAIVGGEDVRDPHFDGFPAEEIRIDGVCEARRHYTDDLERRELAWQVGTDHVRVSAEPSLPQPITDHGYMSAAFDFVLSGKRAPYEGGRSQHGEKIRRHKLGAQGFRERVALPLQADLGVADSGQAREDILSIPPVEKVLWRGPHRVERAVLREFAHRDETIALVERELPQNDCIYHRKDGSRRTDAQRQDDKRHTRERGCRPQRTHGMAGVAPEEVQPDRSHITHGFRGLRHATKIAQGHSSGFARGYSAGNMRLDLVLHVKAQFVFDLGADPAPPGDAVNVCQEPCEHPRTPAPLALMFLLIPTAESALSTAQSAPRWRSPRPNDDGPRASACRPGHDGCFLMRSSRTRRRPAVRADAALGTTNPGSRSALRGKFVEYGWRYPSRDWGRGSRS